MCLRFYPQQHGNIYGLRVQQEPLKVKATLHCPLLVGYSTTAQFQVIIRILSMLILFLLKKLPLMNCLMAHKVQNTKAS